jgi:mono/diheme cytochrome c family protein
VKNLCILLAIAFPLLSAASDGNARMQNAPASPSTAPGKSLIAQGRARYLANQCDECHGPDGEGGGDGPDLTRTHLDAAGISKFLENPSPDAYMKGMPNIPPTHPDHQALVAYVLSLKRSANPPQNSAPVPHKLSATEKAHVLDGDFTIEKTVDHLPDSLKSAFAVLAKEHDFKMANPGEGYRETDTLSSETALPGRRLIFAGISKNGYFIYYEKGGWAHAFHLAIFDVNAEGKVDFLWGCAGGPAAHNLAHLRTIIAAGKFTDDLPHYF